MAQEITKSTKAGMMARNAAVRRLIESHSEEYERVLGDERESRGIPRERTGQINIAKLKERREKLIAQLAKIDEAISQ